MVSNASDDLPEPDLYDSLVYIYIIDTMRTAVNNLLFVDRSQWERYDITYENSAASIKYQKLFGKNYFLKK